MRETKIINEPSEAALDKLAMIQLKLSQKHGTQIMKEREVKESA